MKQISALLFSLLLATGCSVGPDYSKPEMEVPESFAHAPSDNTSIDGDLGEWWREFKDPKLEGLIEEALKSNLDLQLAEARVREARALVEFSRSDFFPLFSTTSEYSRSKSSENARQSFNGSSSSSQGTAGSSPRNIFQAGFEALWSIDIFGGTRREVEAAKDTLEAQIEARRGVMVSLLSEVAINYLSLRGVQEEIRITEENIKAERETLDIQQQRLSAGLATDLTVAQAEAQLQATKSQLPALETSLHSAIHRLGVLLGKDPSALQSELVIDGPLPKGPPQIPVGVPSELLRRRPDIRRAERTLAAATANIGVATADLFPRVNLNGTLGLRSEHSNNLFEVGSEYYSFGPSMRWEIFSWYAILDNIEIQNARQEQALIAYKQTVLQALSDVENALIAYDREQARYQELQQSVDANRRAFDLARQLYSSGVIDFLNVLNTQQALFLSEDRLSQSNLQVSSNLVLLYKALGGGWSAAEENRGNDYTSASTTLQR